MYNCCLTRFNAEINASLLIFDVELSFIQLLAEII